MASKLEPSLRHQLVEARAKITAQLEELNFRSAASGFARGYAEPPDYRSVIAELEDQRNEINAILGTDNETGN